MTNIGFQLDDKTFTLHETSAAAAEAAADRAESAAETLSGSVAQIATNTQDITQLKEDLDDVETTLETKAEIDGYYEEMTVGNAEQLVSTVYEKDSVPYIFRTAGGSMDIGGREEDMLVGGTIAWNQLARNGNFSEKKYWQVYNSDYSVQSNEATITNTGSNGSIFQNIACVASHKYLCTAKVKNGTADGVRLSLGGVAAGVISDTTYTNVSKIYLVSDSANKQLELSVRGNADTVGYAKDVFCIDLTQMFGSAIADYIYGLEQSQAGTGVAWFKKLFPKLYYAYDAGSLQSVQTSAHKMVGFNAYDNSTGKAKVVGGQQYQVTGTYTALSLDGATVTPDASGYFTPDHSGEITVTGGNATNTCIHLVWDGKRDGEYEAHKEYTYPLDDSLTLRGIPKLDASNNLYYDGDTYESDGTVTRKYSTVDLGTLTWTVNSHATLGDYFYASITSLGVKVEGQFTDTVYSARTNKYVVTRRAASVFTDKTFCFDGNFAGDSITQIQIKDSAYTDAATFKAAMSGVMLVYELATPTTETAEPYQNPQVVDDFGTEEYVTTSIVPVGHVTKYQPNLRAKLEMSPDSPDGDGLYIVQQNGGENTYIPLASSATIQNILDRLTALEDITELQEELLGVDELVGSGVIE